MTSLLRSLIPQRRDMRASLTIDDVAAMIAAGGWGYAYQQPSLAQPYEEVGHGFASYAFNIMQANPIAFAAMLVRARVFGQARFTFRRLRNGEPGPTFGTQDLELLEKPEPTMVTSDMLKRASFDADLAGNWFGIRRPGRIKHVRPDWCWLVLAGPRNESLDPRDVDAEVVGLVYQPGGASSDQRPETYTIDEFAHFAPIPDPIVRYRGMSWLTPIVREIEADQSMTLHKLMFMRQGATPSIVVKFPPTLDKVKALQFIELFEQDHSGALNAGKTAYLGGGADLTVAGADLRGADLKAIQGASETRIAVASGVPAVLLGISEGLAGSSLNTGNYGSAKREFADTTMRDLWATMASSLESIIPPPPAAELWYNERLIPFLAEDAKDAAAVQAQQATSIRTLVDGGFSPDAVVDAVVSNDLRRLGSQHTGLLPVQLQAPGSGSMEAPQEPPPDQPAAAMPGEVRCTACHSLLAEYASPPYRFRCPKSDCKAVTEAGLDMVKTAA